MSKYNGVILWLYCVDYCRLYDRRQRSNVIGLVSLYDYMIHISTVWANVVFREEALSFGLLKLDSWLLITIRVLQFVDIPLTIISTKETFPNIYDNLKRMFLLNILNPYFLYIMLNSIMQQVPIMLWCVVCLHKQNTMTFEHQSSN